MQDMFAAMENNKKSKGSFSTKKFMSAIRKSNVLFDNDDHHDSHEFMNWLLDSIHENAKKMASAGLNSNVPQ